MTINDLSSYIKNFSKEVSFKVHKGGILKIDTKEFFKSVPRSVIGGENGSISVSNSLIFYSPKNDFIGEDQFFFTVVERQKTIITKVTIDVVSTFKPKAHILILLGEELIRSPVMAIYELIKNGYDADSKYVNVEFEDIEDTSLAKITITDSGTGITKEVLENVWFEPGTDFRKPLNAEGQRKLKRSPIFWRIPMGEKGVGRFAVHKLGHTIKLISRPASVSINNLGRAIGVKLLNYELCVDIDWRSFSQGKYLEDVKIDWKINTKQKDFYFKKSHGTKIVITNLKEPWTRGMARQLKRQTISMLSPKNKLSKFKINLDFHNLWLNEFPEPEKILQEAPYKLLAHVDKDYKLTFEYSFSLRNNDAIGSRTINKKGKNPLDKHQYSKNIRGLLIPYIRSALERKETDNESIKKFISKHIGSRLPFDNLTLELYSFDLDSQSLRDTTVKPSLIKELLREHSGIKVFKGDLRVYDYGDPGNDWLGLDLKRVQNKEWFSNNQNVGYVYLDPEKSTGLIEKTNREGFIQNEHFQIFLFLLEFILNEFKAVRFSDRNRWLRFNKKESDNSFEGQNLKFKELIEEASFNKPEEKETLLLEARKLEARYEQDKNTLLLPASVGMTASVAIHEIEKLVPRILETVESMPLNINQIRNQIYELKDYTDGILSILQKGSVESISIIESINQAINNYALKLKLRKIDVEIKHDERVTTIKCEKRLLVMMLMNLIDNSIYWLDTVYKGRKLIYISTSKIGESTSILVVDNGPGFKDSKYDIVSPFFSRKEGGIGIGMYLIDTIMMKFGKLEIIYNKEELLRRDVPDYVNGAAVELLFNKNKV